MTSQERSLTQLLLITILSVYFFFVPLKRLAVKVEATVATAQYLFIFSCVFSSSVFVCFSALPVLLSTQH